MIKLGYPLHWEDRFLQAIEWKYSLKNQKYRICYFPWKKQPQFAQRVVPLLSPEVTNRCNLRYLCPTQYNDTDMPRGFVDVGYFKDVVNHIKNMQ